MTFNHCKRSDLLVEVRRRYKTASGLRALKIAAWVDANCTAAELQTAFGLTAPQATALKTRLGAKTAQLAALVAAAGE